ncbi:glycoside hydrolase family 114 protein [Piromyces sp. E2]|nr:glycoside hydrolase family 114 protein [Piromyces sp. E2]|eukprot:OUM62884.1 glycoside hydrolase family 114 protein [Piromyces sp. E2]
MKFLLPITLLLSTLLLKVNATLWKPKPGLTWDYLLGGNKKTIQESKSDVVSISLDYAEKMVPILHKKGQKAICYFCGGSVGRRFVRALKYQCDGVEVDSFSSIISYDSKNFTVKDVENFAIMVAETAHEVGISVGLKNCSSLAEKLERYFDFAIVESCALYNECRYFKKFTQNNKAVFSVHYNNLGYSLEEKKDILIRSQRISNFTCIISDYYLQKHSINYDCNTDEENAQSKKTTTITKKTKSLAKKATTTTKRKPTTKQSTPSSSTGGDSTKK